MAGSKHQKRFTVSLDEADYDALIDLGQAVNPPLNLQYLLRLSVRNLLEQYSSEQLSLPLDRPK